MFNIGFTDILCFNDHQSRCYSHDNDFRHPLSTCCLRLVVCVDLASIQPISNYRNSSFAAEALFRFCSLAIVCASRRNNGGTMEVHFADMPFFHEDSPYGYALWTNISRASEHSRGNTLLAKVPNVYSDRCHEKLHALRLFGAPQEVVFHTVIGDCWYSLDQVGQMRKLVDNNRKTAVLASRTPKICALD